MDDADLLTTDFLSDPAAALERKDNPSVVVMDSGLGGLSVFAALARGLWRGKWLANARLTYFNAWPEQQRGYNALPDMASRVKALDRALRGTLAYAPDLILVACNTLSVLFPSTDFFRTSGIPMVGIVPFGVDLIHDRMKAHPHSQAVILGTRTTIAADTHRRALEQKGVEAGRLAGQACDQLATTIESDPLSPTVRRMIMACMAQGVARLTPRGPGPFLAALCCTHYGYCAAYFRQSLVRWVAPASAIVVDPNMAMADFMIARLKGPGRPSAVVDLKVVSKIHWPPEKLKAIAQAVEQISAPVAQALMNYHHLPELF
jgi:glutamate racemase